MNRFALLPKLSVMGIRKNGSTYVPYILAGTISVFVFYIFSSILHNDILNTVPHSGYLTVLMQIGQVLLGLILLPFLNYTNSFLIKRRNKELGLYSVLGLEKKHIAVMMLWETLILFGCVVLSGVLLGLVFSKLMFLLLLNMSRLPVDTAFTFSASALYQTLLYFLAAYGINLTANLFHVFRSSPGDLIKGAKKGDREPKRLWITALLGLFFLGLGYAIAIPARIDSNIFLNFLLAVAFVIIGTHQFFKAGLIAILKLLKRNRRFYYKESNYVTVSGMLHRVKKSASSLSNICIFSTMIIITLLCTFSLWHGTGSILHYQYPYDVLLNFNADAFKSGDALETTMQKLADGSGVEIRDRIGFTYQKLHAVKKENAFVVQGDARSNPADQFAVKVLPLEEYNRMENRQETLDGNDLLLFSKGADFGYDRVVLAGREYHVKQELDRVVFTEKAKNDEFGQDYYLVVKDGAMIEELRADFKSFAASDRILTIRFQLDGPEEGKLEFIKQLRAWCEKQAGYNSLTNGVSSRLETVSMNGGLLFLGVFFSIVFGMCLILIMYYKQISEGFDDREGFDIMQKVGMSDEEVRSTIHKQILLVFFLPLAVAVLHTMAGFRILSGLLGVLLLFDTRLIILCGIAVVALFTALYGLSYAITSRTYYRIVKQMN
jgi:putative ABC transport system permease protein